MTWWHLSTLRFPQETSPSSFHGSVVLYGKKFIKKHFGRGKMSVSQMNKSFLLGYLYMKYMNLYCFQFEHILLILYPPNCHPNGCVFSTSKNFKKKTPGSRSEEAAKNVMGPRRGGLPKFGYFFKNYSQFWGSCDKWGVKMMRFYFEFLEAFRGRFFEGVEPNLRGVWVGTEGSRGESWSHVEIFLVIRFTHTRIR